MEALFLPYAASRNPVINFPPWEPVRVLEFIYRVSGQVRRLLPVPAAQMAARNITLAKDEGREGCVLESGSAVAAEEPTPVDGQCLCTGKLDRKLQGCK